MIWLSNDIIAYEHAIVITCMWWTRLPCTAQCHSFDTRSIQPFWRKRYSVTTKYYFRPQNSSESCINHTYVHISQTRFTTYTPLMCYTRLDYLPKFFSFPMLLHCTTFLQPFLTIKCLFIGCTLLSVLNYWSHCI